MMIPKVPLKVKVESGPASSDMKPRKLAAQAIPTTAPTRMKRTRPVFSDGVCLMARR